MCSCHPSVLGWRFEEPLSAVPRWLLSIKGCMCSLDRGMNKLGTGRVLCLQMRSKNRKMVGYLCQGGHAGPDCLKGRDMSHGPSTTESPCTVSTVCTFCYKATGSLRYLLCNYFSCGFFSTEQQRKNTRPSEKYAPK